MPKDVYKSIPVKAADHRLLKKIAADTGESVLAVIGRLAKAELKYLKIKA